MVQPDLHSGRWQVLCSVKVARLQILNNQVLLLVSSQWQQQENLFHKTPVRHFNDEKEKSILVSSFYPKPLKINFSLSIPNCNFICDHVIKASLKIKKKSLNLFKKRLSNQASKKVLNTYFSHIKQAIISVQY